jgi:alkylated DNA repair dioxygenase AlkB
MDFLLGKLHRALWLPRRSIAVVTGDARYSWTHGIASRKSDKVSSKLNRGYAMRETHAMSLLFRWRGRLGCEDGVCP